MKRHLIALILATGILSAYAQSIYPGQHASKMAIETSAPCKAYSFDLRDVKLLPGRVRDNLERDSAWIVSLPVNSLLHSFRNNAGIYAGLEGGYESVKKLGGWESLDCDVRGHTTGHIMSASALMYAATHADVFKAKADSIVDALALVQEALGNGYLSAFPEELINRNLRGQSVWAPWYTLHKILAGLIDVYLYTDNSKALDVAIGMADWAHNKLCDLTEDNRLLMLRNEFGGMNEAFYNLYAITGNEKHLWLAQFFYHNDVIDPLAEGNTDFGKKHTNTFIPKVIGEARNYELTNSHRSQTIAQNFWNAVTGKHTFVTGSCSQTEHFFDPAHLSEFINGYTGETCCTYNMLKLSRHLFSWTASPNVADYYEKALFNHILGQQDTCSGMVAYFLPLLSGAHKVYSTPSNSFWCCVGTGFENHAKYAEAIYYHSDDELFINLFIPSQLNWEEHGLSLTQSTLFPEQAHSMFTVDNVANNDFTIALRHPSWCNKPTVKINGKKFRVNTEPGSYIRIKRKWKKGDVIEMTYPMQLHVETTPDNPLRGAILYGPIVLAGDLGTEGMEHPAPFSNPNIRNDYYTYDYKVPDNLNTQLEIDPHNLDAAISKDPDSLHFTTRDGRRLMPLYDAHHCRYVVYWDILPQ